MFRADSGAKPWKQAIVNRARFRRYRCETGVCLALSIRKRGKKKSVGFAVDSPDRFCAKPTVQRAQVRISIAFRASSPRVRPEFTCFVCTHAAAAAARVNGHRRTPTSNRSDPTGERLAPVRTWTIETITYIDRAQSVGRRSNRHKDASDRTVDN